MAFEDDLGQDPTQPVTQDFAVSSTGLVSRTLSLLARKFVQYIIIVGIIGAACIALSFVLIYGLFGGIGTFLADPIGYVITFFLSTSEPDMLFVSVSLGFAVFAFLINAFLAGAAVKFTLDEYGGPGGNVGTSYSHSLSRFLPIVIFQIIISSLVSIVMTPATILSARAMDMIDISDPFNPIFPPGSIELIMQAFGLMIVGGIILIFIQIRFVPTLAIIVDTDLSAFDALKESWDLTSGNMFHILVGWILLAIVNIILGMVVAAGTIFLPFSDATILVADSIITALLFGAVSYIFGVVLYRDLSSQTDTSQLPGYVL